MKKFLIVTLVMLFGMGMMTGNALGDSYDPTYNPAAVTPAYPYGVPPIQQLGGMLWNHGNIGDALSGPMYRAVVDQDPDPFNFVSFVSIENVSNNFVAAHVRLRSGRYSIEVRDFPILLSPRDVFWFQFEVESDGAGGIAAVRIRSEDTNTLTLSGLPSSWEVDLDPELLNQFKLLYPDGAPLEELTQGYIEVFGLFELPTILGLPNVDAIMNVLWTRANAAGFAAITDGFREITPQDVGKSLAGHVFLGDFTNGLYFGYPMNAIKDFRTNCTDISGPAAGVVRIQPSHRDIDAFKADALGLAAVPLRLGGLWGPAAAPALGDWGGQNAALPVPGWYPAGCILYNPTGSDDAYSDPDWATSFGPTWNDGDDLTLALNLGVFPLTAAQAIPAALYAVWPFDSWSLDEVDDALVKQRVQNTYFNGGFSYIPPADPADPMSLDSGTFTLLSVSFITKYLHYFYDWGSGLMNLAGAPIGDPADGAPFGFGSLRYGWPVGFQTGQAPTIRAKMDVEGYTGVVSVRASVWDFEENRPDDFSPYTQVNFPWEVNFLPIGDLSIDRLDDFCFLIVPQPDSPFDLVTYPDYFGGQMFLEGFNLTGGVVAGDPRTIQYNTPSLPPVFPVNAGGYGRGVLPLLGLLEAAPYNDVYIMPASVVVMDWEFTNFSHARSFFANWDNQVLPIGDYPVP